MSLIRSIYLVAALAVIGASAQAQVYVEGGVAYATHKGGYSGNHGTTDKGVLPRVTLGYAFDGGWGVEGSVATMVKPDITESERHNALGVSYRMPVDGRFNLDVRGGYMFSRVYTSALASSTEPKSATSRKPYVGVGGSYSLTPHQSLGLMANYWGFKLGNGDAKMTTLEATYRYQF